MPEIQLIVLDPSGLHARPAARFVQVASRFASTVRIRSATREADAKSLIAVLGLAIRPGSQIVIATAGPDADAAIDALVSELSPFVSREIPGPPVDPAT
ncbi:MAG TPA: HPr family phosphocarrier protein [Candidatus Eisenbacteria bacterium]|nr:HPr family phosphocarrier protein [Candidatus Eisenbacteria bacterium]